MLPIAIMKQRKPVVASGGPTIPLLMHMDGSNGGTSFPNAIASGGGVTININGTVTTITGDKVFGTASAQFTVKPGYIQVSGIPALTGAFSLILRWKKSGFLGRILTFGKLDTDYGFGIDTYVNETRFQLHTASGNTNQIVDTNSILDAGWIELGIHRLADNTMHFTGGGTDLGTPFVLSRTFSGLLTLGMHENSDASVSGGMDGWCDELILCSDTALNTTFPYTPPASAYTYT